MPELPEIETICRGLRGLLTGLKIVRVKVLESRLRNPISSDFCSKLQHKTILGVWRKGKYILIPLEGGRVWLTHLGMSGKLIFVRAQQLRLRHDHIIISLNNGHELRYNDPRRFGLCAVVAESDLERLSQLERLGIDPLDHRLDARYLYAMTRSSKRRIRDFLIDQTIMAGLGNIYANEILFHAGIRPARRAWRLSRQQIEQIAKTTPEVLHDAIRWRGTSFSDYRDGQDRKGGFQNHLQVYDKEGESCRVCRSKIRRVTLGNRSAFFCPKCQE